MPRSEDPTPGPLLPHGRPRPLSSDECLTLLRLTPIGRIVFTDRALPGVTLVRHTVHGGSVLIATDAASAVARATRGAIVAYEVDHVDLATLTAWSVVVLGRAEHVLGYDDVAELASGLTPLDRSGSTVVVRIAVGEIEGWRIGP